MLRRGGGEGALNTRSRGQWPNLLSPAMGGASAPRAVEGASQNEAGERTERSEASLRYRNGSAPAVRLKPIRCRPPAGIENKHSDVMRY